MKEIACSSATEFLECLRITHDLWGGQPAWDWGFRGQGNADWNLLPSAFREGTLISFANSTYKAPIPNLGEQHWCEFKLIQHFLYLADRVGLSVPETRSTSGSRPRPISDGRATSGRRKTCSRRWPSPSTMAFRRACSTSPTTP